MNITLLAVTYRVNGVCIAGVEESSHRWVRPVMHRTLVLKDILVDGNYMHPFGVYHVPAKGPAPRGVQSENTLIDTGQKMHFRYPVEDRSGLLDSLAENKAFFGSNAADVLKSRNRSLMLIGPVGITKITLSEKSPRIGFLLNGIPVRNQNDRDLPCTDLKFRAFCRSISGGYQTELGEFADKKVYILLGLTEEFMDDYWPMVIGFHTVPDYQAEIDYSNL